MKLGDLDFWFWFRLGYLLSNAIHLAGGRSGNHLFIDLTSFGIMGHDISGNINHLTILDVYLMPYLKQVVQSNGIGESIGRSRHILGCTTHYSLTPHLFLIRSPRADDLAFLGLG